MSLFVTMTGMIRVDEVERVATPQRILEKITPQREPAEVRTVEREFAPIVEVALPPMPPVSKIASKVGGLPVPVLKTDGWLVSRDVINFRPPAPQAIGERVAQAVRQPTASYPPAMARIGQGGTCEVHFSLSTRGLPYDISATCSHPGFEKEAAKAVGKAQFLPEIRQGVPVESHNYVYPMEFRLQ
ncbi:energy transducer TonB [Hyphomonas sp.]|uniref:energy transducer TonB n=1 Tax=Hyphomonas sp. TaxID=87 RepID=UPI003528FCE9